MKYKHKFKKGEYVKIKKPNNPFLVNQIGRVMFKITYTPPNKKTPRYTIYLLDMGAQKLSPVTCPEKALTKPTKKEKEHYEQLEVENEI